MKRQLLLFALLLLLPATMMAQGATWQSATLIASGSSGSGTLDEGHGDLWFKIEVPEEGRAAFTMTFNGNLSMNFVELVMKNGDDFPSRVGTGWYPDSGKTFEATDLGKGTYYLHAQRRGGSGTLTLTGQSRHALATGEYLLLDNGFKGSISILGAAGDGIHAEQYFDMRSGTITIAGCAGDGIDLETTNDPEEEYNDQVFISGGSVSIDLGAAEDVKGIKCDNLMTISGGTVNVKGSGDGVKGIKTSGNLLVNQSSGSAPTITINVTGTTYHKDLEDESKTRGIKVDGDFTFDGGNINISATGKKAKAIAVDGTYYYKSGTINCAVDATNIG